MADVAVRPQGTTAGPISEPYRPSWVNVLNESFERLPGPTWLAYLAAIAAGVAFTWPWSTGALARFLSAVLLPIGLWLITRFLERIV